MRLRFQPGDRLGQYSVERHVGGGGYGQVYLARSASGEPVAIKVVILRHVSDARAGQRLIVEVRSLKKLDHPNVVAYRGEGEMEDCVWIAMEFLQGETLQKRLERGGRLSVATALRLLIDWASGLQHVHEHAIVHRDIKPANLFIRAPDDKGVVIDLGAARVGAGINTTHKIGTPLFVAPDYIGSTGGHPDPRWDIWALGAVAYLSIVGRHFLLEEDEHAAALDPMKIVFRTCTWEAPDVASVLPNCPKRVSDAIARCLVHDPELRWQTCADLAAELQACLELHGAETTASDELQVLPFVHFTDSVPAVPAPVEQAGGTTTPLPDAAAAFGIGEGLPAPAELARALGRACDRFESDEHASKLMREIVGRHVSQRAATMEGLLHDSNPWIQGAAAWVLVERGDSKSLALVKDFEARASAPWLRDVVGRATEHAEARRRARSAPYEQGSIILPGAPLGDTPRPAAGRAPDGSRQEPPPRAKRASSTVGTLAGGLGRQPAEMHSSEDLVTTMRELRRRALEELRDQGVEPAATFERLFVHENPWVRASAGWALVERADAASLERVRRQLEEDTTVLVHMLLKEAFTQFPIDEQLGPTAPMDPAALPTGHPGALAHGGWAAILLGRPLYLIGCICISLLAAFVLAWWKWL